MSKRLSKNVLGLVGAPFKFGQPKDGVNLGPKYIKERLRNSKYAFEDVGLYKDVENSFKLNLNPGYELTDYYIHCPKEDVTVRDLGNFIPDIVDHEKYTDTDILNYNISIANIVKETLDKDCKVLTIGGDHSVAIGSINGVLNNDPNTVIIWIDAHADINTQETSPSGNMHGMPVAYLTGLEDVPESNESGEYHVLKPKLGFDQIVYIGIRDLDEGEIKILEDHNILAYWSDDVKRMGIEKIMDEIFKTMDPKNNKNFHLSFDIDGIDPFYAPSTGTTAPDGLSAVEILTVCDMLRETKRLRSMDIVEVNPLLGSKEDIEKTVKLATDCVEMAMVKLCNP